MDVEDIAPGQNFADTIDKTLANCGTVLVVIGPKWLQLLRERAAQGGEDYVRHEIETALKRKAIVIPVLVGGSTAAQLASLPPSLADLPFHQAVELHDSSFKDDCDRLARSFGAASARRRSLLILSAAVAFVLLFLVSKSWFNSHAEEQKRLKIITQLISTSRTQAGLGEYESSYRSATQAAKVAPADTVALNEQVDAAMRWLENYSVLVPEGAKAEDVAVPQLAELMLVLDAGLARTTQKEPRSADILAHIGWAHWLNSHIAEKEFGPAAQQAFRQAIAVDPTNVYANAMLGNWLLQNQGSLAEASKRFSIALSTGRERPLVRTMQLGAMLYDDADGVSGQALKALNDMRKNNEPIADSYRTRFYSYLFSPYSSPKLLSSVVSAIPKEEAWQTYLWLDTPPSRDPAATKRNHDLMRAKLLP